MKYPFAGFGWFVFAATLQLTAVAAPEKIYVDAAGVMRWTADQSEVALFGANYSLPSSCDYRAAGYVGADRKKLVEKDLTHFARMGWDGMRLCLWGDWENSDHQGNLIVNDHLDVMDYAIAEARKRGISILFSPITTYSAGWPDGKPDAEYPGFSSFYKKSELGTNPAAIAAQCNYLRQILEHVNPYTSVALKDEPAILFIEMINEPWHHADDLAGSVAYINALVDAVRSTGCQKLLFHNLSQDFAIAPAIAASKAQGMSIAWYPTGLLNQHTLTENYLRWADDFFPMHAPDIPPLPRIVYEFDSGDMVSGYMYPAMTRAFRESGAQFAAMFSYDMLDTAPYNLGWQTHFLNLVYTPRKAVSAIIAAEVMRTLPRHTPTLRYPENRRFGPFRVSYEEDSSEMVTPTKFIYANDTPTAPPEPAALQHVIGTGNSPVVSYGGLGIYFLDRIDAGLWRLEVYPDAVLVQDPFAQKLNHTTVSSRLVWRTWPMQIKLPDLGDEFVVTPLNPGNPAKPEAKHGHVDIRPGVYLLTRGGQSADRATLPARIGSIGMTEFVCPAATDSPLQIVSRIPAGLVANQSAKIEVDVVDANPPRSVVLHTRRRGTKKYRDTPMQVARGYGFSANLPAENVEPGVMEVAVTVETKSGTTRFPSSDKDWSAYVFAQAEALPLFAATTDSNKLAALRITGDHRGDYTQFIAAHAREPDALRLFFPDNAIPSAGSHVVSWPIKTRVAVRSANVQTARAIRVVGRHPNPAGKVYLTLVEADGTAWMVEVPLPATWAEVEIPLDRLIPGEGLKLPLGYPGNWNFRLPAPSDRGGPNEALRLDRLEHLQISLQAGDGKTAGENFADLAAVDLLFK